MWFAPVVTGTIPLRSGCEAFLQAFRDRVAAGLLTGRAHPRSNYLVSESAPGRLVVRAADSWTAFNVGLNRVELRCHPSQAIHYDVRYWRWAQYALGLSAVLGLIGLVLLLGTDVRGYIARNRNAMVPGLSDQQNLVVAWMMVLFWGFLWPWLLIAMHKRPLRRLVRRLVAEVDAQVTAPSP